jgi:hypothetical protein
MTEIDLSRAVWRKSRRSQQNGECVEVSTQLTGTVTVRDSKSPGGTLLTFAPREWQAFVSALKAR